MSRAESDHELYCELAITTRRNDISVHINVSVNCVSQLKLYVLKLVAVVYRERTIRLAADTIRLDSMQKNIGRYDTDTIRLLNCLLC